MLPPAKCGHPELLHQECSPPMMAGMCPSHPYLTPSQTLCPQQGHGLCAQPPYQPYHSSSHHARQEPDAPQQQGCPSHATHVSHSPLELQHHGCVSHANHAPCQPHQCALQLVHAALHRAACLGPGHPTLVALQHLSHHLTLACTCSPSGPPGHDMMVQQGRPTGSVPLGEHLQAAYHAYCEALFGLEDAMQCAARAAAQQVAELAGLAETAAAPAATTTTSSGHQAQASCSTHTDIKGSASPSQPPAISKQQTLAQLSQALQSLQKAWDLIEQDSSSGPSRCNSTTLGTDNDVTIQVTSQPMHLDTASAQPLQTDQEAVQAVLLGTRHADLNRAAAGPSPDQQLCCQAGMARQQQHSSAAAPQETPSPTSTTWPLALCSSRSSIEATSSAADHRCDQEPRAAARQLLGPQQEGMLRRAQGRCYHAGAGAMQVDSSAASASCLSHVSTGSVMVSGDMNSHQWSRASGLQGMDTASGALDPGCSDVSSSRGMTPDFEDFGGMRSPGDVRMRERGISRERCGAGGDVGGCHGKPGGGGCTQWVAAGGRKRGREAESMGGVSGGVGRMAWASSGLFRASRLVQAAKQLCRSNRFIMVCGRPDKDGAGAAPS